MPQLHHCHHRVFQGYVQKPQLFVAAQGSDDTFPVSHGSGSVVSGLHVAPLGQPSCLYGGPFACMLALHISEQYDGNGCMQ